MTDRESLYVAGVELATEFCSLNNLRTPEFKPALRGERCYDLGTCAFYRPYTIRVMVDKCANRGVGGRAWSWPAYVIDRTPYGVVQHELGHHVDAVLSGHKVRPIFSERIYAESQEPPLTGYLGTDKRELTFYMEWFAENFRLFVTNPDLSMRLRPKFYAALSKYVKPISLPLGHHADPYRLDYVETLRAHKATQRILSQAIKKVEAAR